MVSTHSLSFAGGAYCATRIIQPTPNLSASMPKREEKNVLAIGHLDLAAVAKRGKQLVGPGIRFCVDRQRKAFEIRVSRVAPVGRQNRSFANADRRMHQFVLGSRRPAHRFIGAFLEAHHHLNSGAEGLLDRAARRPRAFQ
jgi:hypothetical protein